MATLHDKPLRRVLSDPLLQAGHVLRQRAGQTRDIEEDPSVPLLHRDRAQGEVGHIEVAEAAVAGRAEELAVELVGPRVIGAGDGAGLGRGSARKDLVAAVAADIGKGIKRAVLSSDE